MLKVIPFLLLAAPALAQTPVTPEEFEGYATGRTLSYAAGGQIFGTEQYLPDRRVVWAFEGEDCQYGRWYPKKDQICFAYEDGEPQCWTFWQKGTGLAARYMNDTVGMELSEVKRSSTPLNCPGPDVGV